MDVLAVKKRDAGSPDFTLLLSRLENEIIKGENLPASRPFPGKMSG